MQSPIQYGRLVSDNNSRPSLGQRILSLPKRLKDKASRLSTGSSSLESGWASIDSRLSEDGHDVQNGAMGRSLSDSRALFDNPVPTSPTSTKSSGQDAVSQDSHAASEESAHKGLAQHKTVKKMVDKFIKQGMEFGFNNAQITTNGGHVASHNIFNTTVVSDESITSHFLLKKLPFATKAPYNNTTDQTLRRACTENTRTAILSSLYSWAVSPSSAKIYWLNGMAGTGKTTIAYSFCQRLERRHILGASFFCSRRYDECAKVEYVLPSIAIGLARRWPEYAEALIRVLQKDEDAGNHSIVQQFNDLILGPCLALLKTGTWDLAEDSLIVVIDALDECLDQTAVQSLLAVISRYVLDIPLKFFLTSRPEQAIRRGFALQEPDAYLKFLLHDVEKDLVAADIELYLRESLTALVEGRSDFGDVEEEWPSTVKLRILVERADRLFIYAATACKFIGGDGGDIYQRFDDMTSDSSFNTSGSGSLLSPLDALYTGILQRAYANKTPNEKQRLQILLSSIVHVRDPLTLDGLSYLVGIPKARSILSSLHSVISVPAAVQDGRVSVFHASFPDYLTDPSRSGSDFYQDSKAAHRFLAERCLRILHEGLKENICGLPKGDKVNNSGIPSSEIAMHIGEPIRYACLYWVTHLVSSDVSPTEEASSVPAIGGEGEGMGNLLRTFIFKHLLHWVECLSLLGKLDVVVDSLRRLEGWVQVDGLRTIIVDARRFVQNSFSIISSCCMEVYHAAVIFAPRRSITRIARCVYAQQTPSLPYPSSSSSPTSSSLPQFILGFKEDWDLCEQVIPGGERRLIVSPGEGRFIAWLERGSAISVSDGVTHSQLFSLSGHLSRVESIEFSHDEKKLVSAGCDQMIKIWDASNGELERTYRVIDSPPAAVFTLDDQAVIYVVRSEARMIDLTTSAPALAGNSSKDATIPEFERVFAGHEKYLNAVVVSPDGIRFATASDDCTARIWNLINGHTERVLTGHTKAVTDVVFLSASRIATSSKDWTVRLWDVFSGEQIALLTGHTDNVMSLHAIPGSASGLLVSGSDDSTVRIWDTRTMPVKLQAVLEGHSGRIYSVRLMKNGSRVISGSWDKSIRIWGISNSTRHQHELHSTNGVSLERHSDLVTAVTISPDGNLAASGSADNSIMIWDLRTGRLHSRTQISNRQRIVSLAFSLDSSKLAIGAEHAVYLYDVVMGEHSGDRAISRESTSSSSTVTPRTVMTTNQNSVLERVEDVAFSESGNLVLIRLSTKSKPSVYDIRKQKPELVISEYTRVKSDSLDADTGASLPPPPLYIDTEIEKALLTDFKQPQTAYRIVDKPWRSFISTPEVKQFCWIPPQFRDISAQAWLGTKVCFGHYSGQVTAIDLEPSQASTSTPGPPGVNGSPLTIDNPVIGPPPSFDSQSNVNNNRVGKPLPRPPPLPPRPVNVSHQFQSIQPSYPALTYA